MILLMAAGEQGTAGQGGRRSHCNGFQVRMLLSGPVSLQSRRSRSAGVAACSLMGGRNEEQFFPGTWVLVSGDGSAEL